MFAAVLLALIEDPKQLVTDIQARIPKTPLVLSLALSDWKEDKEHFEMMRKTLGDKVHFVGTCAPAGTILTVISESNEDQISPKAWRERLGPPGKHFDVQGAACVDASSEVMTMADYHAYFATRTHVFDLHVSRISEKDMEPLPRAEFERIVKSMRVLALRRGWAEDYPSEIRGPMTVAAVVGVTNDAWAKKYMTEHEKDWPAHFANAEYLRFGKAPVDVQIAAYEKALALITKVEKPDDKVRFTTAMLYDGLSLAQYDAKKYAESIAPLEKGLAILEELKSKERGGLAYNLACVHALSKHGPQAIAALAKAVDADPRYKDSAAKDTDFDSVKNDPAFQALIAKTPAGAGPPKK